MNKWLKLFSLFLVTMLLLVACGGAETPADTPADEPEAPADTPADESADEPADEAMDEAMGEVTLYLPNLVQLKNKRSSVPFCLMVVTTSPVLKKAP